MSFTEVMYKGFLGYYLGETGTQSGLAFLMLSALGFLVVVLASYLLGSCNFAIIISGKLFKEDILEVVVPVTGEKDSYTVSIKMEKVVAEIAKNIKNNHNKLEYRTIVQALTKIFNSNDI